MSCSGFFFSSRRRHTRWPRDWSSDVCSSDLGLVLANEEVVNMMDTSLEVGSSPIIPVGMKKNGGFNAYSKVADEETFQILQSHIRKLIEIGRASCRERVYDLVGWVLLQI